MKRFSKFGEKLCGGSGIEELMDDLGHALAQGGDHMHMLGGGQPSMIPEVNTIFREALDGVMSSEGALEAMLGKYDPPRGNPRFIEALTVMFREQLDWDVKKENIAITSGGQTAFFFLFNALAGLHHDGTRKKIVLPLVPEYIGYANQSVGEDMFVAFPPKIEKIGDHQFKYRIDFDRLVIDEDVAAICVSRPTNPTGNVITDNEIAKLLAIAKSHDIPLIIDNAYGAPFPNIFFADAEPLWDSSMILTMSLSKVGLPGTRTGIVVAPPKIASAMASMNAIVGLANSNVGQVLTEPLIRSGKLMELSKHVVKPFYLAKSLRAQEWVKAYFPDDIPYRVHLSEGALFLWIWFEGLPISSKALYERLKQRNVLVVSGAYFFFGLDDTDWKHQHECIRMTYTMDAEIVESGVQIIADEIAAIYRNA
ncbi:valine--pyruvate transaminase [Rubritalea marina]|uniref:valine--pyruvate transaminase n=1 Tax=Rubritalea marina TaxID=361055 RepID=UPI0003AB1A4E|nr:valine--pyruvate transaminase [Rubritalea marina]